MTKANKSEKKTTKADLVRKHPGVGAGALVLLAKKAGVKLDERYVWNVRSADKKAHSLRVKKGLARRKAALAGDKTALAEATASNVTKDKDGKPVLVAGFRRAEALKFGGLKVEAERLLDPKAPEVKTRTERAWADLSTALSKADVEFMGKVVQVGLVRAKHLLALVESRLGELFPQAGQGALT